MTGPLIRANGFFGRRGAFDYVQTALAVYQRAFRPCGPRLAFRAISRRRASPRFAHQGRAPLAVWAISRKTATKASSDSSMLDNPRGQQAVSPSITGVRNWPSRPTREIATPVAQHRLKRGEQLHPMHGPGRKAEAARKGEIEMKRVGIAGNSGIFGEIGGRERADRRGGSFSPTRGAAGRSWRRLGRKGAAMAAGSISRSVETMRPTRSPSGSKTSAETISRAGSLSRRNLDHQVIAFAERGSAGIYSNCCASCTGRPTSSEAARTASPISGRCMTMTGKLAGGGPSASPSRSPAGTRRRIGRGDRSNRSHALDGGRGSWLRP